jgi:hypothetical protein
MPNITPSKKGGRSVDCSDLLAQKKRSIYLAIARNSNGKGGGTQQSNKQLGYDNGFMELKSKRGLDEYLVRPSVIITATYETAISSIKITGYTLGTITQTQIDDFKNAFASLLGISPNLIQINLSSGSLIIDISLAYSDINTSSLTPNEIAFIVNKDSIIEQLTPTDISTILTDSNTATVITQTGASISIDYRSISVDVNLVNDCLRDKTRITFRYPLVGDIENNCMYTIIDYTVVKINKNGTISTIALFPESQGCGYIFIDSTSSFLVIPSNVKDTTSAQAQNNPNVNKVYVISLSDGTVFTKTLNEILSIGGNCGFNQINNRFYYTSNMKDNNYYQKLCYIDITLFTETLTAIYTNINGGNTGKIEFIGDNTGFMSSDNNIKLLNFSNNTSSIIAGKGQGNNGIWNNVTLIPGEPNSNSWINVNGRVYGPYLDASIGTNAFFSFIQDITYDSENNRLLVCDSYAQRIRSVNLKDGNNYAVTTIAGTSPVSYGQADNSSSSSYSQKVLNNLGQVGDWNNGTNEMPLYTKVNSSYLNSTFYNPRSSIAFKGKIYVLDVTGTRQLVNNRVSDFIVFE